MLKIIFSCTLIVLILSFQNCGSSKTNPSSQEVQDSTEIVNDSSLLPNRKSLSSKWQLATWNSFPEVVVYFDAAIADTSGMITLNVINDTLKLNLTLSDSIFGEFLKNAPKRIALDTVADSYDLLFLSGSGNEMLAVNVLNGVLEIRWKTQLTNASSVQDFDKMRVFLDGNKVSIEVGQNYISDVQSETPSSINAVVCPAGQHSSFNLCVSDVKTCALANGSGNQVWNGVAFGSCVPVSCNNGYFSTGTTCSSSAPTCMPPQTLVNNVCTEMSTKKFIKIASGVKHSCAIDDQGKVYCWGDNSFGQLGNNKTDLSPVPVAVENLSGVKQIALGTSHSCAINAEDKVYCWGDNASGQLGNNSTVRSLVAVPVANLAGIKQLSLGEGHTCAIDMAGKASCWGYNGYGQLGNRSTTKSLVPVAVYGLVGVKQIALGTSHSCAIDGQNKLYCWGDGDFGKRGNNTNTMSVVPVAVAGIVNAKQIALGSSHTCAIDGQDKLFCWGRNSTGQLGMGQFSIDVSDSRTPVAVINLPSAKQVALGKDHSCAIDLQDKLYCWGDYISAAPVLVPNLTVLRQAALGERYSCALDNQGKVYCWGDNAYGQLANNSASKLSAPVNIPNLNGTKQIASSAYHRCSIDIQSKVYCWGRNSYGQLGNNSKVDSLVPVLVANLTGVKKIAVGENHSCAIDSQDKVYCWGRNSFGMLGNNSTADSLVPVPVSNLTGAKQIVASAGYTCAIDLQDKVYCWGSNSYGVFAVGALTMSSSKVPYLISPVIQAKQIAVSSQHACAIDLQDKLYCWGGTSKVGPAMISSFTGAKQISVGTDHTCAIDLQDKAYCWGSNSAGQFGSNTTFRSLVPMVVPNLVGVVKKLYLTEQSTYFKMGDGTVQMYGQKFRLNLTPVEITSF